MAGASTLGAKTGCGPENLDIAATFRFLDLSTELRLLVYSELLGRRDPDTNKCLFPNILATSKEIYSEASPELYTKTNLRLTIKAVALKSRDWITDTSLHVGLCKQPFLATLDTGIVTSAWDLYNTLPPALSKISNMTLQIVLSAHRHKGLLKHNLAAEHLNQLHQILAALAAMWKVSGALRTLKIEFVDDTRIIQGPPSPHPQMMWIPAGEMERSELSQIFYPLRDLGAGVVVRGSGLPSTLLECIAKRKDAVALHPFEVYSALASHVDAVVVKVRAAGLCCTQIGSADGKPCAIRSLEKKVAILREGILACRIGSQQAEENVVMDLEAVSRFLESRKVRDLVELSTQKKELMYVTAKEEDLLKMTTGEEDVLCLPASVNN